MGISKKSAPIVDDADLNRAFSEIYDDINEIIDSVNSSLISLGELSTGKAGDLRISKVGEDKYRVEARATEGWIRPGGTDDLIADAAASPTNPELATKVNEIITQLQNITFRLVKKGE